MVRSVFLLIISVLMLVTPLHAETRFNPDEVVVLDWDQLMPADFSLEDVIPDFSNLDNLDDMDPKAARYMDEMQAALSSAPVVSEMNNKLVKIPGFIVPVQSNGSLVSEFFLVPYFGACIHVPPPPSNQIIYVYYEPGVMVESLYDPVWVTGNLETAAVHHELAASGYSLDAFQIEPYEEEPYEDESEG